VLVNGKHFAWHRAALFKAHTNLIFGPKVYRWLLISSTGEQESVYIGESVMFENRLNKHRLRFREQNVSSSLARAMADCERRGGIVELQFLDLGVDGFLLNCQPINAKSLNDHEVRLMMENISIIMAKATNLRLINKLRESAGSRAVRWIMAYADKHGAGATLEMLKSYQKTLNKRSL
jgi:hypothetical protein